MIPYLDLPTPRVGGIEFPWFMILVVLGIAIGTEVGRARAIRRDLSVKITIDCTLFMLVVAFLMAHVAAVVFYFPDRLATNWKAIFPWVNFSISSMGGFLGAGIAIPLFLKVWKKVPVWPYTDTLAIGISLGFAFGRIGCFSAHDHIGRPTSFFLGVRFPETMKNAAGQPLGTRHDLGLDEALLLLGIFALLLILDRNRERFHGLLSGVLLVTYFPARFAMDFLRATDIGRADHRYRPADLVAFAREWLADGGKAASDLLGALRKERLASGEWLGLTFAQYGCIFLTAFGVWILVVRSGRGQQDTSQEVARDFARGRGPGAVAAPPEAAQAYDAAAAPDPGAEHTDPSQQG